MRGLETLQTFLHRIETKVELISDSSLICLLGIVALRTYVLDVYVCSKYVSITTSAVSVPRFKDTTIY